MTADPWDVFAQVFPADPKPAPTTTARPTSATPGTGYAMAALDAECARVLEAPVGTRNHALNRAAFSLGQLVGGGALDEHDVTAALTSAGRTIGLDDSEIGATVGSGLKGGKNTPRGVPDPVDTDGWLRSLPSTAERPAEVEYDPQTGEVVEPVVEAAVLSRLVRERLPTIDWHALWADTSEEEWIVEPILPARRLIALYSAPKVGKSLLLLELCCAIATGRDVLGVSIDRPRRVLYVDFENDPKADVRERLQAMGYAPDDLGWLHYLSFPTLAALDSDIGGRELMAAVAEYECEVVVVDTVSRSIAGEENENDTWLSFYRHTGLRMKQAGISLIRLDHSGKDESKGQRGGSAKSGDVDAVWRLSRITDDSYRLDCEAARMPITEKTLVLHREVAPLRHRVDAEGRSAAFRIKVDAVIRVADELRLPRDAGRPTVGPAVRGAGLKAGTVVLDEAIRIRAARLPGAVPDGPGQRSDGTLSPIAGDSAGQRGSDDA